MIEIIFNLNALPRSTWYSLPPHLQDHVIDHLSGSDFPVDRDRFTAMAERAGWQAHWI